MRVQDSLGVTLQSPTYNVRGMRTGSSDADRGSWTFLPNALGEVLSQTDALGQTTSFSHDLLGRMISRTEPEGAGSITSTWTWGTSAAAKNIGKLAWMEIAGTGVTTYRESYLYDADRRPSQRQYTEGGNTYLVDFAYHATTKLLQSITYPTGTSGYRLALSYTYQNGSLKSVTGGGHRLPGGRDHVLAGLPRESRGERRLGRRDGVETLSACQREGLCALHPLLFGHEHLALSLQ